MAPPITRRTRARARAARIAYGFLLPFLLVFSLSIVAPLIYAVVISLYKKRLVGGTLFVGLDNYVRAIQDPLFQEGLARVLAFLAVQVPCMLVIALCAALAIDSGRLAGRSAIRIGLFLPYAVPAVVAALMWGYIFGSEFGLAGQIFAFVGIPTPDFLGSDLMLASIGNVVTWSFVGYNMLIFYAALRSIPVEIYEAAAIDGAGEWRVAWSIKIPSLRPSITLALIFSVIGSLQLFNEPSVLQALRPSVITSNYTPNLYAYNLAFAGGQSNYAAAIAVILGGVTVVIAYLVQLSAARRERLI